MPKAFVVLGAGAGPTAEALAIDVGVHALAWPRLDTRARWPEAG